MNNSLIETYRGPIIYREKTFTKVEYKSEEELTMNEFISQVIKILRKENPDKYYLIYEKDQRAQYWLVDGGRASTDNEIADDIIEGIGDLSWDSEENRTLHFYRNYLEIWI